MKAKRKWLLGAVALMLALGGALALPFFIDELPPDDADILPRRIEVPWEENGYTAFDVEPDDVYLPEQEAAAEEEGGKEEPPGSLEIAYGERWDPEIARKIVDRNADVLHKLEECLARPGLQFPLAEGHEVWAENRRPWLPAATVLLIRARSHLKEGRHEDATGDVERVIRLGRRVQAAGGLFVHFMSGLTIEACGLKALRDLAEAPEVDPTLLAPLARGIGSASGVEAARETLKTEYAIFSSDIGRILSDPAFAVYLWDTPSFWYDPLFLKPNASRRLLAGKLRVLARNLELPVLQRADLRLEALEAGFVRRWVPRPNAVGRSAVHSFLVLFHGELEQLVQLDLNRALIMTLIALKCWKARHGALPPSLDALVPEYLDAVPRDPYDGKALRYSAEKRIVYSVGKDGEDAGGSGKSDDEAAFEDEAEPTIRLEP